MFAVPEGPSEAKIPITVRRIHLIRRPYAKRRGRRETMFDCPLSKTVKILDQRSCSKRVKRKILAEHRSLSKTRKKITDFAVNLDVNLEKKKRDSCSSRKNIFHRGGQI